MKKLKFLARALVVTLLSTVLVMPTAEASTATKAIEQGVVNKVTATEEKFELTVTKEEEFVFYSDSTSNNKAKITVLDSNAGIVKADTKNFKVVLKAGKYFVNIQSTVGKPLNCNFAVVGNLGTNEFQKINSEENVISKVYRLNLKVNEEFKAIIETCSNENDEEDTVISLYDSQGVKIDSNDDKTSKFASLQILPEVQDKLLNGEDFFVVVSTKNTTGALSTGIILTNGNTRGSQYVEFIEPKAGGYFLKNEELQFKVYGSPAVSEIKLSYKGLQTGSMNDSEVIEDLGTLTKDSKTNTFKGTIKCSNPSDLAAYFVNGKYESPKFVANPKGHLNQVNMPKEIDGYITMLTRDRYIKMDKSWYYNSPFDHSFVDYGTNKYNCFAYGYDIIDESIYERRIPESSNELAHFEEHILNWQWRVGPAFKKVSDKELPYTNLINYCYGSHYGKVTEWDAEGRPTKLISKWGQAELIESNPYDLVGYGQPSYWVNGKYDRPTN